jgi:hypothetical protein
MAGEPHTARYGPNKGSKTVDMATFRVSKHKVNDIYCKPDDFPHESKHFKWPWEICPGKIRLTEGRTLLRLLVRFQETHA